MTVTLDQLLKAITTANLKLDVLMSQQDNLDLDVQAIQDTLITLQGDTGAISAELDALRAQIAAGQPVDLTGLDSAVATLKARVAAVGALVPPPAPPAPTV